MKHDRNPALPYAVPAMTGGVFCRECARLSGFTACGEVPV